MNRSKKVLINTFTAITKQLVTVACGFILPRAIIGAYGSEINGLVSSITQFLGFITLMEMGIGPVIQSNLYKPLASGDSDQVSRIVISSERFFRRIAVVFLIYIGILLVVYPAFVNTAYDRVFTGSLLAIIAFSTFMQYYFGMTYQLLLNADQKAFIPVSLQMATIVLNTVFSILLIRVGAEIHAVKLCTALLYTLRPLFMNLYVRTHYQLDKTLRLTEEPIRQKWNGFTQHVAAVINGNTDVFLLTFFSTMSNVSVYMVYFMVVSGLTDMIVVSITGIESAWGNMIARNEKKALTESFNMIEWGLHTFITVVFTTTVLLIVPFVRVYTDGITDVNYIVPLFACCLVAAYAVRCIRVPYFAMVRAAGHYRQTQKSFIIQTLINICISSLLVSRYELVGVGIGTFIAMLYHTIYFENYLNREVLDRSAVPFFRNMATDICTVLLAVFLAGRFRLAEVSYFSWVCMAFKVFCVCLFTSVVVNAVFNRSHFKNMVRFVSSKL